jgi:hypothetical protein
MEASRVINATASNAIMYLPWKVAAAWQSVSIRRLYGQDPVSMSAAGMQIIPIMAADEKR